MKKFKGEALILGILVAVALSIRWIAAARTFVIAKDSILYIESAKLFYSGNYAKGFQISPYSIYPIFIALFYPIMGDWVKAGQLISVICGGLTVIPLYFLSKRLFGKKAAVWATIFYAICPNLVKYSGEVLRETFFILFYIFSIWMMIESVRKEGQSYLLGVIVFCLISILIRKEGVLLLPIFLFYLLFKVIKKRILPLQGIMRGSLFILPFIILVLLPFEMSKRNSLSLSPINNPKRIALFALGNLRNGKIWETSSPPLSLPIKERRLIKMAHKYKLIVYFSHIFYKLLKAFSPPLFFLFLLGTVRRKAVKYNEDEIILAVNYCIFFIAFLFQLFFTNYLSIRYPLPLVGLSLIWSGIGSIELRHKLLWLAKYKGRLKKRHLTFLYYLLIGSICISLLIMSLSTHRKDKKELKDIGIWLKDHGFAHSVIAGQREFVRLAFYADSTFISLPKMASYENVMKFLHERKATLFIINGKTIENFCPDFWQKLSSKELQRIYIKGVKTPKYSTMVFVVKRK